MLPAIVGVLLTLATFGCCLAVLSWLFAVQITTYNSRVADDLLQDWEAQLELLGADERAAARRTPAPNVVAAMVLAGQSRRRGHLHPDLDVRPAERL